MKKNKKIFYPGWELKYFDKAINFRNYQFDLIKKYIKGTVAEVGPGNGFFLRKYLNYSKKIYLYEPSYNLFKVLKKIKNIKSFNSVFKKKKNFYDTIIYLDVIEHIKLDKAEILKAFSSLKLNGALIINVPAFQILYSKFDKDIGHIKRYRKKDFFNLIPKSAVKKLIYYDSIGFFLSFLSKFLNKNYLSNFGKKIHFWNILIPFSKILDKLLFNLFGKSLLVVIIKK